MFISIYNTWPRSQCSQKAGLGVWIQFSSISCRLENDRPVVGLAVDSRGSQDIVYVAFRQGFPNTVSPNARPQEPAVVVSTDGGKTFANPVSARGQLSRQDWFRRSRDRLFHTSSRQFLNLDIRRDPRHSSRRIGSGLVARK